MASKLEPCPDCGHAEDYNPTTGNCHNGWCDSNGTVQCSDCGQEMDSIDGRTICDVCEYDEDVANLEDDFHATHEEPVWYTLSDVIERTSMPHKPWEELMALAQILHDLRINDTNKLMRRLGAVYVEDDSKPLRGEYHYFGEHPDPDRFHGEIGSGHAPKEAKKEPVLSNRRKAIMAQKERKHEGS